MESVIEAEKTVLFLSLQGLGNSILNDPIVRVLQKNNWRVAIAAFANGSSRYFRDMGFDVIEFSDWRQLRGIRKQRYELIFSPFPSWRRELLALISARAAHRAFLFASPYQALNLFSSEGKLVPGIHDLEQNFRLLQSMEIHVDAADLTLKQKPSTSVGKIALHPTASTPAKYYPLQFWRNLLAKLSDSFKEIDVFSGPDQDENEFCSAILKNFSPARFHHHSGLDFLTLTKKINEADCFIGTDSALMHLAALLDKNVIALWSFADYRRIYPYGNHAKVYLPKEAKEAKSFAYPSATPIYLARAKADDIMAILSNQMKPNWMIHPTYKDAVRIYEF